jgi:hypothetical protein
MTDPTPYSDLLRLQRQHEADQAALMLAAELNASLETRLRNALDQLRSLARPDLKGT